MKRIYIVVITTLFSVVGFSQISKNIDSLSRVLEIYYSSEREGKKIDDTAFVNTLNLISYKYFLRGNFDSCGYYANEAMYKSNLCNYQKGVGVSYMRMAIRFDELGNYPNAFELYNKALVIFREIGDKKEEAGALGSLGSAYADLGNFEKSFEYYSESLKIFESINDEKGMSNSYINISILFANQRRYDLAIESTLKALPIKERMGDKVGLGILYGNLGAFYTNTKNFELGLFYYEKSLGIKQEMGDVGAIGASACGLGSLNFNLNNYDKALEYYLLGYKNAKLANSIKWLKQIRFGLFRTYFHLNQYANAEIYVCELLEMNRLAVSINFSIFSEKEKELYLKTIMLDFDRFNSFALFRQSENPSITELVYNTILIYKGLLLKSSTAMKNAVMNSGDKLLINNYEDWIDLKKQIAKVYSTGKSVEVLEEQADSIEKELIKKSQVFSDFERSQKLTWKDIQASLKPNEAAIEFVDFDHEVDSVWSRYYAALIVKPNSQQPEMIPLFEEKHLEKILGDFQGNNLNYINTVYGKRNEKKSTMYDLIWKPLESSLSGTKKVFISPTGLLHKVSFSALSKEQNIYLCDNYSIQMVASTGKVSNPESFIFDDQTSATIFGGIEYSSDSTDREIWNYLEGTKLETQKISQLFSKHHHRFEYCTSTLATETQFKSLATSSNILHIATHGFFYPDPKEVIAQLEIDSTENGDIKFRGRGFGYATFVENENPLMRSGLVFAGANDVWSTQNSDREDGVLTAQEVAHIDMRNTQLVVLSACETGLGDIKGSEGVYGLQRAFKMAGVKFIIMSLWQVPDKETAEFMTLFYKRLIKLKDIHLAFSQTQKAMRAKYDPYYWAAFVLIE